MVVSTIPSFTDELAKALRSLNDCLISSCTSEIPPLTLIREKIEHCIDHLPVDEGSLSPLLDRALAELDDDHLFPEDVEDTIDSLSNDLPLVHPLLRLVETDDEWTMIERLCGDGYIDNIASFKSRVLAEDLLPDISSRVDTV